MKIKRTVVQALIQLAKVKTAEIPTKLTQLPVHYEISQQDMKVKIEYIILHVLIDIFTKPSECVDIICRTS